MIDLVKSKYVGNYLVTENIYLWEFHGAFMSTSFSFDFLNTSIRADI